MMICQNYWFALIPNPDLDKPISELIERVDCTKEATTVVYDSHTDTDVEVCESCGRLIELTNWLHSTEGQAALEELDPWEEENND